MIIFPAIDMRGGQCVRLQQGDYDRETVYHADPIVQALSWQEQGGEFLHLVDLDGARYGWPMNLNVIQKIIAAVDIPCELGGGIRTQQDVASMLGIGLNRVILGTAACENPELVIELLKVADPEQLVIGIDARHGRAAIRGWREETGLDALELAAKFADLGICRFIYTDITTDGMLTGPNLPAVSAFCDQVPGCRVIASGGVSAREDVTALQNLAKDNLEGVIVGKALYDGHVSLTELLNQD